MNELTRSRVACLRARGVIQLIAAEWAPALTLALVLSLHDVPPALAVAAAFVSLLTAAKLRALRQLGPLAPFSTSLVWLVPTVAGAAIAAVASIGDGAASVSATVSALLASWVMLGLGALVFRRFSGGHPLRCALIGDEKSIYGLEAELDAPGKSRRMPLDVIGRISPWNEAEAGVIGSVSELRRAVTEHGIDLLILADGSWLDVAQRERVLGAAVGCMDLPVRMIDSSEAYEEVLGHLPLAMTGPRWVEAMMLPGYRHASAVAARCRDVVLTVLFAPLAVVLLGICAAAIALTDGFPIFHRQRRIGAGGREFTVIKLRSMRDDIEGDQWWAQEDDPRVTPVGRFLRRTHLDELPQLWSVFTGEMSLVGPRPEVPEIVEGFEVDFPYYDRRHLIRPGLTGWAQVSCGYAGTESGSAWKLCFDLYYLKHRSFVFDLLIMAETLRVVCRRGDQYGLQEPDPRFIVVGTATVP